MIKPTAEQITELRAGAGLSRADFGAIVNASTKTVQSWELGARDMPAITYEYLLHALGIRALPFGSHHAINRREFPKQPTP